MSVEGDHLRGLAIVGRESRRSRLLVVVIVVLVIGALGWVGWIFLRSPGQREVAIQLSVFVLTVVTALIPAVLWLWRARRGGALRSVDALADLLAHAVHAQWRTAATERVLLTPPPIPIRWSWSASALPGAGELTAALDGPFKPLPGLTAVTKEQLRVGGERHELFKVYAGLGSGRIMVVGSPGSGKSGSAVLLLLDVLDHRAQVDSTQRNRVAVPVLFTAHSWDPTSSSVQDWLCDQLTDTYPLFQHPDGRAEAVALVSARDKVTLILDGLDEIDESLRPAAVKALSDAPFRVVVLSRRDEMIQATRSAWFVGAVVLHLDALAGGQAATYLERAALGPPPSGWSRLLTHLRDQPHSDATKALSTPLALTLIRDTYRTGDDVNELLDADPCTAEQIEQHLIARVLPAAYVARPGKPSPRYSAVQATQTLAFIARQMSHHHTRDLAWWHIPRWAPATPRIVASVLAGGLLGALASWLLGTLGSRLTHGSGYSLFYLGFGLGLGILFGLAHGRGGGEPKRIRSWRAVNFRSFFFGGFAYGVAFGVTAYVIVGAIGAIYLLTFGIESSVLPPVVDGFVVGTVAALPLALKRAPKSNVIKNPDGSSGMRKNWRTEKAITLIVGLLVGVMVGLAGGHSSGIGYGLISGLMIGLVGGLLFAAAYGITRRLAIRSVVEGESSPLGPRESWRNDRVLGMVAGLAVGLSVMVGYWLYSTLILLRATLPGATPKTDIVTKLTNGVVFGIVMVLVFGITSTATWSTTIAWLQLHLSRRVPTIAIMSFLEDARDRGALRTVGAVYQFRHATLQDQLANQVHNPNPIAISASGRAPNADDSAHRYR